MNDFYDKRQDNIVKECYELALLYDQKDASQDLIRERYSNLSNNVITDPVSSYKPHVLMQDIGEIISALSSEQYGSTSSPYNYNSMINSLPECAEKYYFYALITLKSDTTERSRINAVSYLNQALKLNPNDPRINALRDVLISVS